MLKQFFSKNQHITILALLTLLVLSVHSSLAANNSKELVIGLAGPMSGERAFFGEQMREAAEIAVQKINAEGGILGKQVTLDVEDDANEPQQAVSVANRLVSHDVRFVVGHWGAGMTLPASDVYDKNDVLMITPASILSETTIPKRKLIFRAVGTDKQIADKIAEYFKKANQPSDKIVFITDNSAPATQSISKFLALNLNQAGYTSIDKEYYSGGDKDFGTLVTKIKEEKPAAIYCSCYQIEGGLIIRALRTAQIKQPIIGTDVFDAPELWKIAGAAGEGTIFISDSHFADTPMTQGLVTALKTKNIQPQPYHYYTYASFQILKQAMENAHSLDPDQVAEQMHKQSFDTVRGVVNFADNGDLQQAKYDLYIRKNGQTVPLIP